MGSKMMAVAAVIILMCLPSCHSSKKAQGDIPALAKEHVLKHTRRTKTGERIVEEAMSWLGTPYGYAMSEKGAGTDCSGMVMKVYEDVTGKKIPRNSAKQAEFCKTLNPDDVMTGDLVFFATGKDPEAVSHVGIIIDNVSFIHASSKKGVVISNIDTPYYRRTFKKFGRPEIKKDK